MNHNFPYLSYHFSQVEPDYYAMKHKNISNESGQLLSYFNNKGKSSFQYAEAFKALPGSGESAVKELLSDMTKRGLLMRLKEGLYYIIPYEADPVSFMPDWHLIAGPLAGDVDHYIGYYSALQAHNLIIQPSLKEQIVVAEQIRPSTLRVKGVPFQFIYHNPKHFFGSKKIWIDSYNKVQCSDLEKTFIDCLFKPDYAGGIVEISRALLQSKDELKFDVLLSYAIRFESQAVVKRLGFLLELLDIRTHIIPDLQKIKTASFVSLDTKLPSTGKFVTRWSIQQNVDSDTIYSAIVT
ncbi:MAG TPA: transcriptional regulator [Cyclobacteriaceae bacterium]|nr:transcriptional regulator [Cyclobacteriaceae bacterium]